MSRPLGVGAVQMETFPGDIQRNLETLAGQVESVMYYAPWVRLICAHELCIQGTLESEKVAQEIPGPMTDFFSNLARRYGIFLVPGSMFERSEGHCYNTAPVFNPEGEIIAKYRKMYPWRPYEHSDSGHETVVFEMPDIGVIGVCICYDLWFPELIRDLVLKGAEIILIPTATASQDREQELVLCRAAAIANQCYVVNVNGLGNGGKGLSVMVDPEGNILQQTGQMTEKMIANLDLERVAQVRKHGTCGVTRPLASFFREQHCFHYQQENISQSPIYKSFLNF